MPGTFIGPRVITTPNVSNLASVQVAPPNPSRTQLYAFNPGANVIWVAPILDNTQPGNPINAIVSGNGSVPIQPLQGVMFPGFLNGMAAISAAGVNNVLTIWEYFQ